MQSLVEEREKLQLHLDDARKLLHPVRSLPDDILREIFSHCVPRWADLAPQLPTLLILELQQRPLGAHPCVFALAQTGDIVAHLWSTLACTLPRLRKHLTVTEGARLQSMSQLERLSIYNIADTRMPSPLSLPRLERLVLVTSDPSGVTTALPMFNTPALKELYFNYHPRSTKSQPGDELVFPSAPTIMQNITLLGIYLNTDILSNSVVCSAFVAWLQEAPNVSAFALWHWGEIPIALLESLIVTPTECNGVLLPKLTELRLHNLQAEPTPDATIRMDYILSSRKTRQTIEVKEGIISGKVEVVRLSTIYTNRQ
ncbi:hypothetical protein BDZ89DRAFT_1162324 [Hymenopellis radicata]|nr:hypothetical protein BDZ89DRAFT_1162324 [Hymenopellis radicata]